MAKSELFRYYSMKLLLVLFVGYFVGLMLAVIPIAISTNGASISAGSFGVIILLAESIFVMAYDWRGAVTVRGTVKKQIVNRGQTVSTAPSYVFLYLLFPEIILPLYLIRTVTNQRSAAGQRKLAMQHQIATMEAQLGILPQTSGTCRVCHKPLLIGSEFCQYCGESVIEYPKVCPSCATTALPDAKWCPKCRTLLP
jgi:hypothetical protein